MSLRLLLDEDSQAKLLVSMLGDAEFDLVTVAGAGLEALDDLDVLTWAIDNRRTILTRNCDDFRAVLAANPNHSGVIAIYSERDATTNMSYRAIVDAVKALAAAGFPLDGQFIALNAWRRPNAD